MRDAATHATTASEARPPAAIAFDPAEERGLLVVLPHPDDETFSSGGTMARCADAGVRVTYLCGTYGDMGRRMGRPAFAHRESLRDVRERELAAACAVLGAEWRIMGLRDKCVEFEDPHEVAQRVREVIEELDPSTVITFYPGFAVHADHDALGLITQLAVRGLSASRRPRLLAVAVGDADANRTALGEHTKLDARAPDLNHAIGRQHCTGDRLTVEQGSVGAAEVGHLGALAIPQNLDVLAARARIIERDVSLAASANDGARAGEAVPGSADVKHRAPDHLAFDGRAVDCDDTFRHAVVAVERDVDSARKRVALRGGVPLQQQRELIDK
mgnify:CR=1 FL=1